jgi:hypothetical protein
MAEVVRLREEQTGTDRYNDPEYGTTEVELPPALFSPERDSSELITVGRVSLSEKPTLYWHKVQPDVRADDRLRVDGVEYDVDGVPSRWNDDLGGTDVGGLVVTLKRQGG